jgi:hypothetical protein
VEDTGYVSRGPFSLIVNGPSSALRLVVIYTMWPHNEISGASTHSPEISICIIILPYLKKAVRPPNFIMLYEANY